MISTDINLMKFTLTTFILLALFLGIPIFRSTFQKQFYFFQRSSVPFKLKELINSSTVEFASDFKRKIALEELEE